MNLFSRSTVLWLLILSAFSTCGFAQKYEVHPLVGRTAPDKWADLYSMKSVSVVGVKGAVFANPTTQIEGEFEYLPHFEFRGTDPKTRGWVWGFSVSRNVFLTNSKIIPFIHVGGGGVTARNDPPGSVTTTFPDRSITIDHNDTFAFVSYGGGVKALELIGPVGLRFNIMGRTMPNFFGRGNTWAEFTGGPVFTWGKK